MKNSKLLEFLQTLSASEMKDLGRYINQASSRDSKNLNGFYNYLCKHHPEFPEKKVAKETVSKKLFPKDANSIKKVQNLMYKLLQYLEDFLVVEELKYQEGAKKLLYLEALKRHKLDKYFFQKVKHIEDEWIEKSPQGLTHLHYLYRLQEMCYLHPNYCVTKEMPITKKKLIDLSDQYALAVKLYWYLCYHHTDYHHNINSEDRPYFEDVDTLVEWAQQEHFQNIPSVKFLSLLLDSFYKDDFSNFQQLRTAFTEAFHTFNNSERNDMALLLEDACMKNYKKGVLSSIQDAFELKRFLVEQEAIIEDGYIYETVFEDIVVIGCAANELEWTKRFIDNYYSYLDKGLQEDYIALCNAMIIFQKNKFTECLKLICATGQPNPRYGLRIRTLQLQCYYELEECYDLFENLVNSFYKLLNRQPIFSDNIINRYSNFIRYTKQLQKMKFSDNINRLPQLKEQFKNNPYIAHKSWLIKKIEELQK